MKGNGFITWMLRSPLHGMLSSSTMLVTVTGSTSGRPITTPVNYAQQGNTLWVTSFRKRSWWRNLRGGWPVELQIKGKGVQGWGRAIEDRPEVEAALSNYLQRLPKSAKYFGVTLDENGQPRPEDIAHAAQDRVMVEIVVE
ncbi:MAG: hypothetical protein A2Z16_07080 [Chloroflexi bacterium RBG_16_54_18]|nr:MAG: hypothetical protein A2Z16_07080 [Chloroflexi bacterium RBG_16_54_18]